MMAGVRPRLEPGSSESKNRSLHQSCLVGTSLSVGHNALILVVKSGFNSGNGGNLFLDHECFQGDYPLGVHILSPPLAITFPHFTTYYHRHARLRHAFKDSLLLPKIRVKWSALLLCIREALSSNLDAETACSNWCSYFFSIPPVYCRVKARSKHMGELRSWLTHC